MTTNNSLNIWYASIKAAGEAKPLQAVSLEAKPKRMVAKQVAQHTASPSQASVDFISSSIFK
jgi:hypothetical protein